MKYIILFLAALSIQSNALEKSEMELKPAEVAENIYKHKVSLELDVFGLSYHTNRDFEFNEVNPGLGLSLVLQSDTPDPGYHLAMVLSGGTYEDSYREQAKYLVAGPRLTLGYENSIHTSLAFQVGYFEGSGKQRVAIIPYVSIGYDRVDLCLTGDPGLEGEEGKTDTTKMLAVFLKFKVLDF